jgi:hypothetical protein
MITETGAAILTIKLIAMANIFSAFTAFYSAIDKLKHQIFAARLVQASRRFQFVKT